MHKVMFAVVIMAAVAMAQSSGSMGTSGPSAGGGIGGAQAGAAPGGGHPAGVTGTPTTQGAVGGAAGAQAASPGAGGNQQAADSGTPTIQGAVGGPAQAQGTVDPTIPQSTVQQGPTVNNSGGFSTYGQPVLATPGGSFVSPSPTAGITNQGQGGISNDPNATAAQPLSTLGAGTQVVVSTVPVTQRQAGDLANNAAADPATVRVMDFAPGVWGGAAPANTAASAMSLGEVARQMRGTTPRTQNASRTYTNADVQRLSQDDAAQPGGSMNTVGEQSAELPQSDANSAPRQQNNTKRNPFAPPPGSNR